eukprot:scaffold9748_cov93-Isochrysis_galbana.AAC.1
MIAVRGSMRRSILPLRICASSSRRKAVAVVFVAAAARASAERCRRRREWPSSRSITRQRREHKEDRVGPPACITAAAVWAMAG